MTKRIKNATHPHKKFKVKTINRNMTRKYNYVAKNNIKDALMLYSIDDPIGALIKD